MSANFAPQQNFLLAALPAAARERLAPKLKLVDMPLGSVLFEPGCKLHHIYFPTESIVALLYVTENGDTVEIAVVGNDGLVGEAVFMGGLSTPGWAVVESAGHALQLPVQAVMAEFNRHEEFQALMLRYTQCLIMQMAQTAVCNRFHTIDQQLSRWLLLSLDRLPSNKLEMTQELIANMLGVRREGVTEAAGRLQAQGIIKYRRGCITVLDRHRLEACCCECYAVVKKESDRLLHQGYAPSGRH